MKRSISLFLAIIILIAALPLSVLASDAQTTERDRVFTLACEAFPEYASTIRGDAVSTFARWNGNRELVFSETRAISENESILYGQYSDGSAIIIDIDNQSVEFDGTVDNSTFEQFTGGKNGTASFTIFCTDKENYPGSYKISNFKYKIYDNTWDMIVSKGSITKNDCSGNEELTPNETISKSASLVCNISFYGKWSNYPKLGVKFTIYVGNNRVVPVLN